jgi:hypothetical protein
MPNSKRYNCTEKSYSCSFKGWGQIVHTLLPQIANSLLEKYSESGGGVNKA